MSGIILVVRGHFDGYVPGDVIKDQAIIDKVLTGPHEHDVIKCMGDPTTPPPIMPDSKS
jgi:hypothetical protein